MRFKNSIINKAYTNRGGSPWGTSNVLAKPAGITKTSNAVYPEARSGHGKCAKLVCEYEHCKAAGIVNIDVIVGGSIFTGEMIELIKTGVPNIVCIQPFACLPNHVVGKGVIKALKKAYPQANIAAVDYDPGASEVNQLNRIKLMLSTARENLNKEGSGVL